MRIFFRPKSRNSTSRPPSAAASEADVRSLHDHQSRTFQLCSKCEPVNVPDILQTVAFDGSEYAQKILRFDLGWANAQGKSCPLCSFMLKVCQIEHPRATVITELWLCVLPSCVAFGYADGMQYYPNESEKKDFKSACAESTPILALLRVIPSIGPGAENTSSTRFSVPTNYIAPAALKNDSVLSRVNLHLSSIVPSDSRYDPDAVRQWLSQCSKHSECPSQNTHKSDIKVIDCMTDQVVPLPATAPYLALSYVWGPHQFDLVSLTAVSFAPRSIRDAMTVVKDLGHRYLWVDRYCIDQFNDEEKRYQLSTMDQIFEGAYATIIATGGDVNSGLSCVSVPRVPPIDLKLETDCHLMLLRDKLREKLLVSAWNTRAWTYQEFCLSKRCLFFFPDQVHFLCNMSNRCESACCRGDVNVPTRFRTGIDPRMLFKDFDLRDERPISLHIRAYARRDLTYQEDALDAFRGLLARCERKSYWGVPLFPIHSSKNGLTEYVDNASLELALGLSYSYGESAEGQGSNAIIGQMKLTTMQIPSWSWANCVGTSGAQGVLFPLETPPACTSVEFAQFFVEEAGKLLPFQDIYNRYLDRKLIPEQGHALFVSCRFFNFAELVTYLDEQAAALNDQKADERRGAVLKSRLEGVMSHDFYLIELVRIFKRDARPLPAGDYSAHYMVVKWIEFEGRAYRIGYWNVSFGAEEHAELQPVQRMIKVV